MKPKNKLLSIGDISKLTGASIKALRYYGSIKLLEPAYVDPYSKYRYYTFDQIYIVNIIMFCVELDIPLKELTKFIDENKVLDGAALVSYGKEIAEKKLKKFRQGLKFINYAEKQIAFSSKHREGEIYSREIPEKTFHVVPFEHYFDDIKWADVWQQVLEAGYSEDDYEESAETGFLYEYSPEGIKRYVFIELPKGGGTGNIKTIPGGVYFGTQNKASQIEAVPRIFGEQLRNKASFIAVETEIFSGKYEINKPINELRVTAL